ncbi:MAG: acyl--CoA ligase family protein [Gemmatimonadota bacterium]|nr:acyl--CoA ligase family protein [Gemmatimonadota bacterium]
MNDKVYRSELTPLDFLERAASIFPRKTAVIHGRRRYTYSELLERSHRLTNGLRSAGLGEHDRVAFLAPNIPAMLEAHYGVPAAGCVLVAINTRLSSQEIGYILEHSGSKKLFVDRELVPLLEPLDTTRLDVIEIADTGSLEDDPYERFLQSASPEPPPRVLADEEESISMNYTSGTTGRPKGVVYSHRGAYLNALGEVLATTLTADSVYLWTLPMFHCNGWCFTWAVTAVGGTHVCLRHIDADSVWDLFELEGITHYNGAPTVQIMLVNSDRARRLDREVTVTIAGAPPSPTLLATLRELNFKPVHVYGLTETYGPTTVTEWHEEWEGLSLDEQATWMATQGQGYVTSDLVRVVDEEGKDIARDGETMGEVVMRGNIVMKEYHDDPEATTEAFRHGWFHSGDLAVWHPDGYVELRDRAKDIIISGGENISTIEVEQAVARHPAVLECAVIAIPHEKWGERPKAFVTLKPGAAATQEEIIEHCRDDMAHFKCPDAVEFGDLPKTSTGKVQKYVLREREWAGRDRRVN